MDKKSLSIIAIFFFLALTSAHAQTGNTPDLPNVVEPNPYDQYPMAAYWASPKAPWREGGWSTDALSLNRGQACEQSLDSLARSVADEEKSGYWTVTQKSTCICRTITTRKNWYCKAYYQKVGTGKPPPKAVSR